MDIKIYQQCGLNHFKAAICFDPTCSALIQKREQYIIKLSDSIIFRSEANEDLNRHFSIFNLDPIIPVKVNLALATVCTEDRVVKWRGAQMQRLNHLVQLVLTKSARASIQLRIYVKGDECERHLAACN